MAQKTTREIELELIKKLYDLNGYFAAAFTKEDIEMMERNIAADYDLLCGTTRDESDKIGELRRELHNAYNTIDEKTKLASGLATERDAAIENYRAAQKDNGELQDDLYEKAHEVERLKYQIIRRDLQLGKELTDDQKQMLIETLEGYED